MKVKDPYFRLERIRKYIDEDIKPSRIRERVTIPEWKYTENSMEGKLNDAYTIDYDDSAWKTFRLYESWGGYDKVAWFRAKVEIPAQFQGKQVAFRALVGPRDGGGSTAETLCYIDGKPVQAIDIWHEEAFLDPSMIENKSEITIALKAWSGVLDIPRVRVFKEAELVVIDAATDKFYFTVDTLLGCLDQLDDGDLRRIRMTRLLVDTFGLVNFIEYGKDSYYDSIREANDYLQAELEKLYQLEEMKPTVTAVGHSHIDMGWLWRYSATREKASRTFSTVLNLMRQFPEYRYMHSSPQLYKFIGKDYPEIFEQIKQRIAEGQWEITGGMWVEPDTNLPNGESLIRQFLFGKRYIQEKFGKASRLVWLPDVFGYSAALPQIMKKCEMDYFMTTKISWNQYNHFPYDTFWWKGIDGSRVFTHFITTPENGSWYYTYNGQLIPEEISGIWKNYKDKDINDDLLLAFGWGDGGGGPTKDQLERARVMKNVPGIPKVQIDTAENYFERIYNRIDHEEMNTWDGELYFEMHRGTYTSQANNKKNNRRSETLLHNVEFLCAYADLLEGISDYPKKKLDELWELVLLSQFHDVLPGSSIRQVYEDSDRIYAEVEEKGRELLENAKRRIGRRLQTKESEIVFFNTIGWERDEQVFLPYSGKVTENTRFMQNGKELSAQPVDGGVLVLVKNIPAYGVSVIDTVNGAPEKEKACCTLTEEGDKLVVESAYYRAVLNGNGQIASLYDKENDRAVDCGEEMNRLVAYEDKPQRFDAWDIDIYYREKPYPEPMMTRRRVVENGCLETVIRQEYSFEHSTICQDLVFYGNSRRIDFKTTIDWKEEQVLLKAYFPVDVHALNATYEIQCGNLERPTHTNTEWDMAKFEVCAHKWVDLSEEGYGVSLLNDCRYGHDINGHTIGITLLKSAIRPDALADKHVHELVYALYPHTGTVKQCDVQKEAMMLNLPLLFDETVMPSAETVADCRQLFSTDEDNLVLDTVKQSEDGEAVVVRLYEFRNRRNKNAAIRFGLPVKKVEETNMLEHTQKELVCEDNTLHFEITPYEIKTFKVWFQE